MPVDKRLAEQIRIDEAARRAVHWKRWGPYLSERQWGTVREDYSPYGSAWDYFPHDHARARAYRWGEDGLGGICDNHQRLCFAIALWNERDPILKERLFGLTGPEGNHAEDVKEYYFYLDSTPTHSYMKYLYKYPQAAFPYTRLLEENQRRGKNDREFELIDTGVFDQDRYFDVYVEYAKAAPDDVLIRITAANRAFDKAPLHLLPVLWYRNTWSWSHVARRPRLRQRAGGADFQTIEAEHPEFDKRWLHAGGKPDLLFTENESDLKRFPTRNLERLYVKDAFGEYVIQGRRAAVNPQHVGTKGAPHYRFEIEPGAEVVVELRLRDHDSGPPFGRDFDATFDQRRAEADEYYASLLPATLDSDQRNVCRQAFAGLLWSKQFFYY
ncbi:MAG: MGH1-like glycoside hydrolase domain-containing protein, partial [Candidatus Binatia bacterium]